MKNKTALLLAGILLSILMMSEGLSCWLCDWFCEVEVPCPRDKAYCSTEDCPDDVKWEIKKHVCGYNTDDPEWNYVVCRGYAGPPHNNLLCQLSDQCYKGKSRDGCPFLSAHCVGNTEQVVNSLVPESETHPNKVVTDYCAFSLPLNEDEYGYNFLLREFHQKHSWFDQFKLFAVDHPQGSYVGVTHDGKILVWIDSLPPIFCYDQNGNSHLAEIEAEDGLCYIGNSNDTLIVGFGNVDEQPGWEGSEPGARICVMSPPYGEIRIKDVSVVCLYMPDTSWKEEGKFYERARNCAPLIHLSDYEDGSLVIRLTFGGEMRIDHIHLIKPDSTLRIIQECPLWTVLDDTSGNITGKLLYDDSIFGELFPSQSWGLQFHLPSDTCPSGYERSFVFLSKGRYVTQEGTPTPVTQDKKAISSAFELIVIQPTPLTFPAEIHYSLPEKTQISLKVYDVSGKLITTIEEGIKESGRYSILWDGIDNKGTKLPTGSYFVTLRTEKHTQTKKLVIVR